MNQSESNIDDLKAATARALELSKRTGREGLKAAAEETIRSWFDQERITADERDQLLTILNK